MTAEQPIMFCNGLTTMENRKTIIAFNAPYLTIHVTAHQQQRK